MWPVMRTDSSVEMTPMRRVKPKPLDRAGAEPDHDAADQELHEVRVHDGGERLAKAALIGADEVLAEGDLLAHTLEDEDVRINRHTDGEHDAGEAGQCHGGADAGHDAQDDDDV
jgi:hypothetical protein